MEEVVAMLQWELQEKRALPSLYGVKLIYVLLLSEYEYLLRQARGHQDITLLAI